VDVDGIDLFETLITTEQAARLAGVTPEAVRSWKHRGHLQPACYDSNGRPMYLGIDVAKAEAITRRNSRPQRVVA
jgi:DNA-binding transcriptional MerR regulator